jgi:hypothetical protein
MYKCAIAGASPLCAQILGCRLLACAPLHSSRLCDFVNAVLPASDFFVTVREHHNEEKSMTTKTPSQRIALLEAKKGRAKADERKQRTRRLIEVGAMLEPLGERVAA